MNENVEHIMLEHLRAIRSDMAKMADHMHTMQVETTSMRQSFAGVRTLQDHDHGDIAAIKMRLDRIEKRWELID